MRKRPWILVVLATVHVVAPIGNLIMNAYWAKLPFLYYVSLFFAPTNFSLQWPHVILPILAGISIYLCRKWSFWFYMICMSALFVFSYMGYEQRAGSVSLIGLVLVYVINIGLVGYFLIPTVRVVYMDPRLRWWQTKPRYRAEFPAQFAIADTNDEMLPGHVVNFSEGGLFMKAEKLPPDTSVIRIQFHYENADHEVKGSVIHHKHRESMGFGVQFVDENAVKVAAKEVTRSLHKNGMLMVDRQANGEEDFMTWLKRVVTTGKGLLPEFKKRS